MTGDHALSVVKPDAAGLALDLTGPEAALLLSLMDLGLDAYGDGATGEVPRILDQIPQAVFDALADKLGAGWPPAVTSHRAVRAAR